MFQIEFPTSTPQNTKNSSNYLSEESTLLHKFDKLKPVNKALKIREIFRRENDLNRQR